MWIVCITSVRHVLTVNGYGGRQTKENEKSWCFKGWETLVTYYLSNNENITIQWYFFVVLITNYAEKSVTLPTRVSCTLNLILIKRHRIFKHVSYM